MTPTLRIIMRQLNTASLSSPLPIYLSQSLLSIFTTISTDIFHRPVSITGGCLISSEHRSSSVMDVKIKSILLTPPQSSLAGLDERN